MPCWTVVTNRIDMPKMNADLLSRALMDLGASGIHKIGSTIAFSLDGYTYTLRDGVLESTSADEARLAKAANQVKRAYSGQVVQAAAAKNHWTLKKTGAFSYVVNRRR